MAKKDNTVLYVGLGVLAVLFLTKKDEVPTVPGMPQSQLAQDIANGDVVLNIEKVTPPYRETFEQANHRQLCYDLRAFDQPHWLIGDQCDDIYHE